MKEKEEKALHKAIQDVRGQAGKALADEDFEGAMSALARLRAPVDAFFDHVTVNIAEAKLRENRLMLLSQIRAATQEVADFTQNRGLRRFPRGGASRPPGLSTGIDLRFLTELAFAA